MAGGEGPHGLCLIAGLDEAGRGCLAGPVVAAAVILPPAYLLPGLTDSKKISAAGRNRLALEIRKQALAWSLGLSWPREIETVNILQASLLAMCRAVRRLTIAPDALVVDGPHPVPLDLPQQAIIRADALIPSVSAASILAKCYRDRLMTFLDRRYPGYDFACHKGYPVAKHLEALRRLGPCLIHRRTFRGVLPREQEDSVSGVSGESGGSVRQERLCLPGIRLHG